MEEIRRQNVLDYLRKREKSDFSRIIFFARPKISGDETSKFFNDYAKKHFADKVTGLMLVYSSYTINIMESTENKIFQFCKYFVNEEKFLGITKYVSVEWNVERFFDKWYGRKIFVYDESSKSSEIDFEDLGEISKIYNQLRNNLYDLCNELRDARAESRVCLAEKLDKLGTSRDHRIPDEKIVGNFLESSWGESLEKMVENYWNQIGSEEVDDEIWPFPEFLCLTIQMK